MPMLREIPDYLQRALAEGRATDNAPVLAAPSPIEERIDEKEFMQAVIDLAARNGWKHWHCYDSRKSAAGFLDLVLVRERVIFAELKTESGRLTAAQQSWVDDLIAAGMEVHIWRPSDWKMLEATLAAPTR